MAEQLGRSRYGSAPTISRRPRRRRWRPAPILIIVIVIVALIFCWVIGRGCGGNEEAKRQEALRGYALEMNKIIDRSATIGTQFDNLRDEVTERDPDELNSELEELEKGALDVAGQCANVTVPELAKKIHPIAQVCFDLRADGIGEYRASLNDILAGQKLEEATERMSSGMMDLVVSDECLARFSEDLERTLADNEVSMQEIAKSIYVPEPDDAMLSQVQALVRELGGAPETSDKRGLAVVGLSTTPARVDTTSSGALVLPENEVVTVKATVENQGNQTEEDVEVTASIDHEGLDSPQEITRKITEIKPNEKKVLIFEELKPSGELGVENEITVTAEPVENEVITENNTMIISFIMRSE